MYLKFWKRFFDICCALCVFIFLFPLYFSIAILVRIKLGKPIYFRQIRPGKNGKLFILYKFRTMTDAKDKNNSLLPDDRRLTAFGKILRKTSLDEIPEAINILKGDMSIIGPRPLLVQDYVFFDENTKKRQSVKPGLSGLAQVKGRNNITWEEKFKYDLEYIKKINFITDFKLILKTIIKAFFKHDDVDRYGYVTDINFGDYLLENNKITKDFYNNKIKDADSLISSFNKKL